MLIHTSNIKIKKIYKTKQFDTIKPNGLWYAENKLWLNFAMNILKKTYKHFYVIKPNYTTFDNPDRQMVLELSTVTDFDKFTFKYGYVKRGPTFDSIFIHWKKVAKKYGGIEVTSGVKNRRYIESKHDVKHYRKHGFDIKEGSTTWFYGFDIPSGCIWDPEAIKEKIEI